MSPVNATPRRGVAQPVHGVLDFAAADVGVDGRGGGRGVPHLELRQQDVLGLAVHRCPEGVTLMPSSA